MHRNNFIPVWAKGSVLLLCLTLGFVACGPDRIEPTPAPTPTPVPTTAPVAGVEISFAPSSGTLPIEGHLFSEAIGIYELQNPGDQLQVVLNLEATKGVVLNGWSWVREGDPEVRKFQTPANQTEEGLKRLDIPTDKQTISVKHDPRYGVRNKILVSFDWEYRSETKRLFPYLGFKAFLFPTDLKKKVSSVTSFLRAEVDKAQRQPNDLTALPSSLKPTFFSATQLRVMYEGLPGFEEEWQFWNRIYSLGLLNDNAPSGNLFQIISQIDGLEINHSYMYREWPSYTADRMPLGVWVHASSSPKFNVRPMELATKGYKYNADLLVAQFYEIDKVVDNQLTVLTNYLDKLKKTEPGGSRSKTRIKIRKRIDEQIVQVETHIKTMNMVKEKTRGVIDAEKKNRKKNCNAIK